MENDQMPSVKRSAAGALVSVSKGKPTASKTVTILDALLDNEDGQLRAIAADGLGELEAEGSVKKLALLLSDEYTSVRSSAIGALGKIGKAAEPYAKEIRPFLDQPLMRSVSAVALGRLGKTGGSFASDLVDCLEVSDIQVRWACAASLGLMAEHVSSDIVDRVAKLLSHNDGRIRATAAATLGCLGSEKAGQHVPTITRLLRDEYSPERNYSDLPTSCLKPACMAAFALGKLGEKLDELARLLTDSRADMRGAACEGLGFVLEKKIDLEPMTLSKMRDLLNDENTGVRQIAEESLSKLDKEEAAALKDGE